MKNINLQEKFALFNDYWSPRILTEVNDQYVKIAKVKDDFVWHEHENEDELFFVVKGCLLIDLREAPSVELHPGEMTVIPKKTQHRPRALEETWILLFEPKDTQHTGDVKNDITNNKQKFI